jgi:hypothetical protein
LRKNPIFFAVSVVKKDLHYAKLVIFAV